MHDIIMCAIQYIVSVLNSPFHQWLKMSPHPKFSGAVMGRISPAYSLSLHQY